MIFIFTKRNVFNTNSFTSYYALDEIGSELLNVNIEDINKSEITIITFDTFKLIESLRELNITLNAQIIDISQIYKLFLGLPSKESKYNNPSSFDKILLQFNLFPKEDISEIVKKITTDVNSLDDDTILEILKSLKKAYFQLVTLLKEKDEYDRFFSIELPVCQILYNRELKGISISPEIFNNRLLELDKLEYSCQHKLRYDYNVLDGKDNEYVCKALTSEKLSFVAKNLITNNIEHILKYGSESNELLFLIYNFRKAKKDKSFLFRFGAIGNNRIYPIFDCIGTITSRILIKEPLIQQLRRSSRDIFIPDEGKQFIYADFGQFEPGILADKSKDKNLIKLYNNGDVYEGLSSKVFGNKSDRKIAKIIFLSYMYGMSIESLSLLVNELYPKLVDNISLKLEKFFAEFSSLIQYKNKLENELLTNNRIGTSIGNYRNREFANSKQLKNREKRWLLSQKIQGTASLILKQAIIELKSKREIEFLIPMHDAVLFQVPINGLENYKNDIKLSFERAFRNECPSIIPKVNFEQFDK